VGTLRPRLIPELAGHEVTQQSVAGLYTNEYWVTVKRVFIVLSTEGPAACVLVVEALGILITIVIAGLAVWKIYPTLIGNVPAG
jgi:hypothetical protein